MQNDSEARLAIFDAIIDTLVDLADPQPGERDEITESMMTAAEIILDRLGLEIVSADDDGLIVVTIDLVGDAEDE